MPFLYSIHHAIPSPVICLLQFLNIILSINNCSFAPLDFLRHLFCSAGNSLSLFRWSYSSSLSIPVNIFHVIGLKLVTSFRFSLSFIISTVLLVVSQPGVSFIYKHNCNCVAILSWQAINVFIQYPFCPSGPRAFQFFNLRNCLFNSSLL